MDRSNKFKKTIVKGYIFIKYLKVLFCSLVWKPSVSSVDSSEWRADPPVENVLSDRKTKTSKLDTNLAVFQFSCN